MTPAALRHLSKTDPIMRALIRRVGPCTIRIRRRWSPFQSLVRAVVYQQLHGRAAAAIFARLVALFDGDGFPSPEQVLAMSPRRMRGRDCRGPRFAPSRTSRRRRRPAWCPLGAWWRGSPTRRS
jgi:DNA-3-methyladenine glycosylase II